MAIFKCLRNLYISTTQELIRKINDWKRKKVTLAKIFNHLIFISKALKLEILPVGFRKNINAEVRDIEKTQWKVGLVIMKDTKDELLRKQRKLKKEELGLRTYLMRKLNKDSWDIVQEKVEEVEKSTFIDTRTRQIAKMELLINRKNGIEEDSTKRGKEEQGRLINLSKHNLSKEEEKLLLKGLDFVPNDPKENFMDITVNVESIMKRLDIQDDLLPKEIMKIYNCNKGFKDNLSKGERYALRSLKTNDNIVIAPSDKGKVTLILDKDDYSKKLEDVIFGGDYEILKRDPTRKIDEAIRKIASTTKTLNGNSKLYYTIAGSDTRWPSIFGNIKVHRVGLPLRVILSSCGTVTENAANFVKKILNYYVTNFEGSSITEGIVSMKADIKKRNLQVEENFLLASIDVTNMFTNISTSKAMEIVRSLVEEEAGFVDRCKIEKEEFLKLVDILLNNSYFKYGDDFYRQKHGIPMGSGISPVIADLVMLYLEKDMHQLESAKHISYYRRFRDDCFIIWRSSLGRLQEFLEDINLLDSENKLKFTLEIGNKEGLAFLDANIKIVGNRLSFNVYSKPYSAGMLLNYDSHQDIKIKRSIVVGETKRYYEISDSIDEDLQGLKSKLLNNSYPPYVTDKIISNTIKNLNNNSTKEKKENKWLSLMYPGKNVANKLNKVSRRFDFKMAFKGRKTIGNFLSSSYKYNTSNSKGVIYSIRCHCGDEYVGETRKSLQDRIKEHKYSIKRMDQNNGIAMHVMDCNAGIAWSAAITLGWEGNWYRRKLKEGIWIQKNQPKMNLSGGMNVRGNWN